MVGTIRHVRYTGRSSASIREYFNHFQSAESTDKRRKVHRSALPEVKCQLHGSGQAISAHFWQGKPVRKNESS